MSEKRVRLVYNFSCYVVIVTLQATQCHYKEAYPERPSFFDLSSFLINSINALC